jgi:peptidoglycan glycosyltransferase
MDRRIRVLALFLVGCFALLIAQLDNIQIRQAPTLNAKTAYQAQTSQLSPFNEPRGEIVTADGVVIARSVATHDAELEQRIYPDGSLYTDITGYYDTTGFAAPQGIEASYDSDLQPHPATASDLHELLTEQSGTDSVVTTVISSIQQAAATALAHYSAGAVVVLDPATGAVLAMYGKPTFDPNVLASHDAAAVTKAFAALDPSSGSSPLINYATGQEFNPGSTFKVITTSAIFDDDPAIAGMTFKPVAKISLPETNKTLQNFGGEVCGGDLAEVLAKSCDTAYAQIGLLLGAENLASEASAFGFNVAPPIDLPAAEVAEPCFPPVGTATSSNPECPAGVVAIGSANKPGIAYSAIGQENVKETALEDAMVAAAVANGGTMMVPHLMSRVVNSAGAIVSTFSPRVWRQATSADTAAQVLELMRGVVTGGTASAVGFPPADHVAAKTGTAETGTSGCSTNWLIATAPADPEDTPRVAVAAVVPYQAGTTCDGTGAEFAGPIVKSVLAAALAATS